MPTDSSISNKRVAITGMGIVSALGIDEDHVWSRLLEGKSGIGQLQSLDTSKLKVSIGAEVAPGLVEDALKPLGRRSTDRALDMAVVASAQALLQAKLIPGDGPFDNQEVSVILGTGTGSYQSYNQAHNISKKGSHNSTHHGTPLYVQRYLGRDLASVSPYWHQLRNRIRLHFSNECHRNCIPYDPSRICRSRFVRWSRRLL